MCGKIHFYVTEWVSLFREFLPNIDVKYVPEKNIKNVKNVEKTTNVIPNT